MFVTVGILTRNGAILSYEKGSPLKMLCSFAKTFPDFVGDLLQREALLTRNMREETVTDMWVAALTILKPYGVYVDLAIECETGADLEIWFLSSRRDRGIGFVIQAKRVKCRHTRARPAKCTIPAWRDHRIEELDHASGASKPKGSQSRDLVNASKRTSRDVYPLYAFYMPQHIHTASGTLESVMLADGYMIRRHIVIGRRNSWKQRSATKSGQIRRGDANFKKLDALANLLFNLSAMFCPHKWTRLPKTKDIDISNRTKTAAVLFVLSEFDVHIMNIPNPEQVAYSMSDAIQKQRANIPNGADLRFPLPKITTGIPQDIRRLTESSQGEVVTRDGSPPLARSRIVFVASNYIIAD